jgi:hypothetical protein
MKLKACVVLLGLCGLTGSMSAPAREFDGMLFAERTSAPPQGRDFRRIQRTRQLERQERQANNPRAEPKQEPARNYGYGYGYERRRLEREAGRNRR